MPTRKRSTWPTRPSQAALKNGFRSGLELKVAKQLKDAGIAYEYETRKISFVQPVKSRTYTPDFILPNGILIETKGRFTVEDRQKHLMIKDQNPGLDIRFVFQNPNQKISKRSKTSYAMWCDKYGFQWASKTIPPGWIEEGESDGRRSL